MKKFNSGPTRLRRALGNLHTQRRILPALAVAAGLLAATSAVANEINLVTGTAGASTEGSFSGGTFPASASTGNGANAGPDAIYRLIDTHPAGTGVFEPFLSYQRKGSEEGINTSLLGNGQGVLDDKRVPQWTHNLIYSQLREYQPGYYAFELDANETGSGNINRLLSIDDIRIWTSGSSPFTTLDTDSKVHAAITADNKAGNTALGQLRYAQNAAAGTSANWVLIDASRRTEGSTSGSGSSDLIVLVPVGAFSGAGQNDFVTFYTLNGLKDTAGDDSDAGFEEWRAFVGPTAVPDGGSTLLLLGSALIPLGLLRARREANKA